MSTDTQKVCVKLALSFQYLAKLVYCSCGYSKCVITPDGHKVNWERVTEEVLTKSDQPSLNC